MSGFGAKRYLKGIFFSAAFFIVLAALMFTGERASGESGGTGSPFCLSITDWKTGEVYASAPAKIGSELFFGWIHSQEKIPWNEYYHIEMSGDEIILVLDAITFPAFGAGIPENKGRVCYVKDGLIHMEEIDQEFKELVWLNSHTATQEIKLDGTLLAKGGKLPQHTRLLLKGHKGHKGHSPLTR